MDSFERIPLMAFADEMQISRNTAKRAFDRGVFPEEWIEKSGGEKWFVVCDDERLSKARYLLNRWEMIRRKPRMSTSFADSGALEDVSLTLFSYRYLGEAANSENVGELSSALLNSASAIEVFNKIKSGLAKLGESPRGQAVTTMARCLLQYRERYSDPTILPSSQEWAEMLDCSVSSLYRPPFGKSTRDEAANFVAGILRRVGPAEIEGLSVSLDGEVPSIEQVSEHLVVSRKRAEDLLEQWKSTDDPDEGFVDTEQNHPLEYFRDGYEVRSPLPDSSLSPASQIKKKQRDVNRRRQEKKFHFAWEWEHYRGNSLHLVLLPTLECETIACYQSADSKVTALQFQRARAQISAKREPFGCIIRQDDQVLARFFIYSTEKNFAVFSDAVKWLVDHSKRVRHQNYVLSADWWELERDALRIWSLKY